MTPPAQPLPPALARLASALELSSGFLLYFLTGPRDHADSVFIRLLALSKDFELVRCRLPRHGEEIEFFDILTGANDDRPRLVFMSGLEWMNTAKRREMTERLNLLRDSWAPHPARIVFWLPSWGLAEFRRIAPDLFDWRSGLIPLSDADLPVRSELEYLVWACERNGGANRLLGGTRRWKAVRRRLELLPRRVLLSSTEPSERYLVLRDIALGYARDALAALAPKVVWDELDNSSIWDRIDGSSRQPPVPVLVRAQDAAGRLDNDGAPWLSLARAAGIPGPHNTATLLATLAEQGRLLILLDGFDQLALMENDPVRRWLEQLTSQPIRLLAATGTLTGFFFDWSFIPLDLLDAVYEEDDHVADQYLELIRLIQALFPQSEDLLTLASYILGTEADEFQLYGARDLVATRLVTACARRGLLDASFFAELTRMRPAHTAEIEAIARSLTSP